MGSENNILIVVPPRDFRDEEYEIPRKIFEDAGIGVKVASLAAGECYGCDGLVIDADIDLNEINVEDFSAIFFVGGPGSPLLFGEEDIIDLAKSFFEEGKLVCAICWATVILAIAGVLKAGDKATAWPGAKEELTKRRIVYTGESMVVQGNVLTADGPASAELFAMKITELLMG
jgi:protease I